MLGEESVVNLIPFLLEFVESCDSPLLSIIPGTLGGIGFELSSHDSRAEFSQN